MRLETIGTALRHACLAILIALVTVSAASAQSGFDRRGGDYTNFVVRSGDPAVCAQRCDRDPRCRAWSFAYPQVIGPRAVCFLKRTVPARVESSCCVSGVRGGGVIEPRGRPTELGIDRAGGDYRSFDIAPDGDAKQCEAACKGENRCRAWTYVRPGYLGTAGRCHLKSRIMPPRRKPCCISGVIR